MQALTLLRSGMESGRQSRGSGSYSFGVHHYGQWHGAPSRPERYCGPTDLERIRGVPCKMVTLRKRARVPGVVCQQDYGVRVRSRCAFGADTDDVQRVGSLVRNLHPPMTTGLQFPIQALENLTGGDGRFLPCCLAVRQHLPDFIRLGAFMVDVEEVSWHQNPTPGRDVWFPTFGKLFHLRMTVGR